MDWDFIRAHLGMDMTALEIARYFGLSPADIHHAADILEIPGQLSTRPTALLTPFAPIVGNGVRKATKSDAYKPISEAEYQAIHFQPEP